MKDLAKLLGDNIRVKRSAKGVSQEALALAVGMDRSYLGRIERGEVNLTIKKLFELAAELSCDPIQLLPLTNLKTKAQYNEHR